MSYPHISHGTIHSNENFSADISADKLIKAIKDSDKEGITRALLEINNAQRTLVKVPFKRKTGKSLIEELKRVCSGDYEKVIVALMTPTTNFHADQLYAAIKGLGTNENALIDVICTHTVPELLAIKNEYKYAYGRQNLGLIEDVIGDTSGDFQKILVAILQRKYVMDHTVDMNKAQSKAHELWAEKSKGLNKEVMLELISQDNYRQLDATFDAFEKLAGRNIEKAIEEEYAGDAKRSLQAMVQCMHDKPKYYAARLYESMKGLGTSDDDLIRLIVSRSEIDLALVRDEFEKQYGKSLIDWIKSECSGAYRDALCLIVRGG